MKITKCGAKAINDSRAVPTIEVGLFGEGFEVTFSVPSGKSTGEREALELRDSDGKGVSKAMTHIEEIIAPKLYGRDWKNIKEIDEMLIELDGTPNKARLGANATLAISIASAKLFAAVQGVPFWKYIGEQSGQTPSRPGLYMNMINGGLHADFKLPFQEYIIVFKKPTIKESYGFAQTLLEKLGSTLKEQGGGEVPLGDEGGYSPEFFKTIEEPFAVLAGLIKEDPELFIAIDAAASAFLKEGAYEILNKKYTQDELLDLYKKLTDEFPLKSIEDPFGENDTEGFEKIMRELGEGILIVGDDLTVTNPDIIKEMADNKAANAVIIKPNQIGTLTETFKAAEVARSLGWKIIASHRSGDTQDTAIADIAFGLGAFGIKAGSPRQLERRVKYERLLQIEREFEQF